MKRERFSKTPDVSVLQLEDHEAAVMAYHREYAEFPNGLRVDFDKARARRDGNTLIIRGDVTSTWTTA